MPNKEQTPLATVNGKNIYASDINDLLEQAPPQQKMYFSSREGRRALLDELIAQNLMYEEAIANGLQDSEEFQAMLKDTEEKLLKTLAIANFMKDVTIDDDEVKKFYDENPDQFMAPEQIRASHILVDDEKLAEDIIKQINDGSKSFEELAVEYSNCPSAQAGGDLNYFTKGQMVPEFEAAAIELEPGQMAQEPVKTQFGYHIIKTTDKKDAEQIPFNAIKEDVKQFLLAQKQDQAFKSHVEDLKQKYPVNLNHGMI